MKKLVWAICFTLLLSVNVQADDSGGVKVETLAKSSRSWDEKLLPRYTKGRPEITILRIKIPPGETLQLHKHLVINAGVLISGELTVITEDNKVLRMKAGDAIVEVVNKWHYGKNEGKETADIIVFYAGIRNKPISVKKE
jgi:quercetin dioxygenase-like cupin family protein